MKVNEYQKAIEQLTLEGYVILQIEASPGHFLFFNVYKWQEGYFNTAQSIEFNTVEDARNYIKKWKEVNPNNSVDIKVEECNYEHYEFWNRTRN